MSLQCVLDCISPMSSLSLCVCVDYFLPQAVRTLEQTEMCETFALWQMRLVLELCESRVLQHRLREGAQGRGLLLSSEFLPVMKNSADGTLDRWLTGEQSQHSGRGTEDRLLTHKLLTH
jgi:hypothetical protein